MDYQTVKHRRERGFASAHLIHESGGGCECEWGRKQLSTFTLPTLRLLFFHLFLYFLKVLTSVLLLILRVQSQNQHVCLCLSPYDAAQWVTAPSTSTFGFLCIVYSSNVVRYLYKNGRSWLGQLSPHWIWQSIYDVSQSTSTPCGSRSACVTSKQPWDVSHVSSDHLLTVLVVAGWFFTKDTLGAPDWPEQPRGAGGGTCVQDYTLGFYQKLPSVTRSAPLMPLV